MPEQLTKHPDVTLQVLKSGGAVCAQGAKQEILTRCPAERFCKLPGGEICVYGLNDAPHMTQPTSADWHQLAQAVAPGAAASAAAANALPFVGPAVLVGLLLGAAAATVLIRRSTARGSR
ncbi:MAG TPA: hypothetical protein VFQ20_13955 [Burkholderiaceae bacterium]|nr:hypothetical protein [Burkholderiaceae bacterium]